MRAFVLAITSFFCVGCAGPQAVRWVPRLVVRGAIVHHAQADLRSDRRSWDWQVQAGLAWPLSQVRRPMRTRERDVVRAPRAPAACAHDALCVWELRERTRAYEAALRRLEEEP